MVTLVLDKTKEGWEKELAQMLNGEHTILNVLRQQGIKVKAVSDEEGHLNVDVEEATKSPKDIEVNHFSDEKVNHVTDDAGTPDVYTKESSVGPEKPAASEESSDDLDARGHRKNMSRQAIVIRRTKLRNIFKAVRESTTGYFDDLFSIYGSVYSERRFAVWLWIFESKGCERYVNHR